MLSTRTAVRRARAGLALFKASVVLSLVLPAVGLWYTEGYQGEPVFIASLFVVAISVALGKLGCLSFPAQRPLLLISLVLDLAIVLSLVSLPGLGFIFAALNAIALLSYFQELGRTCGHQPLQEKGKQVVQGSLALALLPLCAALTVTTGSGILPALFALAWVGVLGITAVNAWLLLSRAADAYAFCELVRRRSEDEAPLSVA